METVDITSLSSKGQVVIPQKLRESMHLKEGEKFMILRKGDLLILKKLQAPTKEEFERMIKKAHEHAEKHHLTPKDLEDAIKKVRKQ